MKKCICIFALLIIITSGCDLLSTYIPDEDLKMSYSRHAGDYLYSNKVLLHLSSRYPDALKLMVDNFPSETVLEGEFIRAAHQDKLIFIETKDAYYVFDIDSYTPPEESTVMYTAANGATVVEKCDLNYNLQKYSSGDFKIKYPSCETFDWFNF